MSKSFKNLVAMDVQSSLPIFKIDVNTRSGRMPVYFAFSDESLMPSDCHRMINQIPSACEIFAVLPTDNRIDVFNSFMASLEHEISLLLGSDTLRLIKEYNECLSYYDAVDVSDRSSGITMCLALKGVNSNLN